MNIKEFALITKKYTINTKDNTGKSWEVEVEESDRVLMFKDNDTGYRIIFVRESDMQLGIYMHGHQNEKLKTLESQNYMLTKDMVKIFIKWLKGGRK
jgi:hypothetical protein